MRRPAPTIPARLALLAGALLVPAHATLAQGDVLDLGSATHIRDEYRVDITAVRQRILALANAIPAKMFVWRPSPVVRTVSEKHKHKTGEWYFVVPLSVGGTAPA